MHPHPNDTIDRGRGRDDGGGDDGSDSPLPLWPPPPPPPPAPPPLPPPKNNNKKPSHADNDDDDEENDDLRWTSFGGGVARRPAARRGGGGIGGSSSSSSSSPPPPRSPSPTTPTASSPRALLLLRPLSRLLPRSLRLRVLVLLTLPALLLMLLAPWPWQLPPASLLADGSSPLRLSDRAYRRAALEAVRTQSPEQERLEEELLRLVTEECARGEDTAIWLGGGGGGGAPLVLHSQPLAGGASATAETSPSSSSCHILVRRLPAPPLDTSSTSAPGSGLEPNLPCPPLDIMLRGQERGAGMCLDVALYVVRAGARIVPMPSTREAREAYDAQCGARTARLFLESMYSEFFYGYEREMEEKDEKEEKEKEDKGRAPEGDERRPTLSPPSSASSSSSGVLHLQLLNSEHMWTRDAHLHARVDAFLCKTRFCERLARHHVRKQGLRAAVWYVGHTSSDPTVLGGGDARGGDSCANATAITTTSSTPAIAGGGLGGRADASAQRRLARERERLSYDELRSLGAVHVKGKSGLKHTRQLLECWGKRPDLPRLVVIGKLTLQEARAGGALRSPNVVFFPTVRGTERYVAAKRAEDYGEVARLAASGWLGGEARRMLLEEKEQEQQQQDGGPAAAAAASAAARSPSNTTRARKAPPPPPPKPSFASFAQIRNLQSRIPLHVCVSEREGFGHYLNEARAAAAVVLTTDHAPMSELVTRRTGVLVKPERVVSYDEMALGKYARINALTSPEAICKAADKALALSPREVAVRRAAVREAFELERAEFRLRLADLAAWLRRRAAEVDGEGGEVEEETQQRAR
jgi:hypothetical protein